MYTPAVNRIADPVQIAGLMQAYPFAVLVSVEDGAPIATHLPILTEPGEPIELYGHMARANPHWKSFAANPSALVIFPGPHGYITPRWYATLPSVPTWNYVSVHAFGRIELIEDQETAADHLRKMIDTFDPTLADEQPDSASREYLLRLLPGVVVFKVTVDRIDAKAKLSQNKAAEDHRLVMEQCLASDDADLLAMGKMMRG